MRLENVGSSVAFLVGAWYFVARTDFGTIHLFVALFRRWRVLVVPMFKIIFVTPAGLYLVILVKVVGIAGHGEMSSAEGEGHLR